MTDNQRCVDETWDTLDAWVCWGLHELQCGVWAATDPWGNHMPSREGKAGQPIAEGWFGCLACHKGDDKYLQRTYHMCSSWASKMPCWLCRATTSGSHAYTLHGKGAPHRSTAVSPTFFIRFMDGVELRLFLPHGWYVYTMHARMHCYNW